MITRVSYRDAPFEVKRLAQTIKPGAVFWTKDYGVDHWKNGKIYFIKVSPPDDDWTEIIEPISVWRDYRSTEDGGIYNEDEDEAGIWPWVS
jgi:hypothetical protein